MRPRAAAIRRSSKSRWLVWIGPAAIRAEWDRSTYLTCFKMNLDRIGLLNARHQFGATILHEVVTMGEHVTPEERVQFATALLEAGARLDLRDDLLESTPLGWACRWGREEPAPSCGLHRWPGRRKRPTPV